jgi:hypothetical protein
MNIPEKITLDELVSRSGRLSRGICQVIIHGECNCGGQIREIARHGAGGLTIEFNFFVSAKEMKAQLEYSMVFGECNIWQSEGHLIIVDPSTKTQVVIDPSGPIVLAEMKATLGKTDWP